MVAILGVLAVAGSPLLVQITRFYRMNLARTEIQRDARTVLDLINRNLRQARAATVTVDKMSGQPPYSRVSFESIKGPTITYWQSGGKLYQQVDDRQSLLSENLRYIAFTYQDTEEDNIIMVSLTMEKETYEGGTKALQLSVEKVRIMND